MHMFFSKEATLLRFDLRDGQMRSDIEGWMPFAKNQFAYLGDQRFFAGDLSEDDVLRIAERLEDGEVVTTFNERQWCESRDKFQSPFELKMTPRLVITNRGLAFPQCD